MVVNLRLDKKQDTLMNKKASRTASNNSVLPRSTARSSPHLSAAAVFVSRICPFLSVYQGHPGHAIRREDASQIAGKTALSRDSKLVRCSAAIPGLPRAALAPGTGVRIEERPPKRYLLAPLRMERKNNSVGDRKNGASQ
jgi:hypothetical protein